MSLEVFLVCFIFFFFAVGLSVAVLYDTDKRSKNNIDNDILSAISEKRLDEEYVKPVLRELSKEEIDDIHSRGKITALEKVKEYEGMDLCAPGDAVGSASWRCNKFHNCHDCLIDYVKDKDEYDSFATILKDVKFEPF